MAACWRYAGTGPAVLSTGCCRACKPIAHNDGSAAAAKVAAPSADRICASGVIPDERVEHLTHRFWVAAHDRGRGLDVANGIKVLPGEREPGIAGELPEEGPLEIIATVCGGEIVYQA